MKYAAFDFETANSMRSSVCALGIAVIDGLQITERVSWLIRPPELRFDPINVRIHGITEDDVADKPEFNVLWNDCSHHFEGAQLLAHNASFDVGVLRQVLDVYNIPCPQMEYYCTKTIAQLVWPKLPCYGLRAVSEHLGIEFEHHDAEEDAVACARVAIRACREVGADSLEELPARTGIAARRLHGGDIRSGTLHRSQRRRPQSFVPRVTTFNSSHPLFGKTIAFSGTLQSMAREDAMQKVVDCGGHCASSVNKETNYLVLGSQDSPKLKDGKKSSKTRKAELLIGGGAELKMIAEVDFLQMLEG